MLGLLWDKSDLFKPPVRPDADTKQLLVPLALLLDPDLPKALRDMVAKTKDEKGGAIKELGQLSQEDFLDFYRKYTGLKA